jgi:hypothetical protein
MAIRFNEAEIQQFLSELKRLPLDYQSKFRPKAKRGHNERELDLTGEDGTLFRLLFRQSQFNLLDFTVIFSLVLPESGQLFRVRRYNGKSHEHTKIIERQKFYDFHIHEATERYQQIGTREDAFALPTGRYSDFEGATRCMLTDCGFKTPDAGQGTLFDEVEP